MPDDPETDSDEARVTLYFALPSPALAPYVSTYYHMHVARTSDCAPDIGITDQLHPEWGNIRICAASNLSAAIGSDAMRPQPRMVGVGPTSRATTFTATAGRSWGIGLLPLGWLRFVAKPSGTSASIHADQLFDAQADPAFAGFAPLSEHLFASDEPCDRPDLQREARTLDHYMRMLLATTQPDDVNEASVAAAHAALVDPDVRSVAAFAEKSGLHTRTLERLSGHAFGFSPKLLLRRQRFLRTLAKFMLDPTMKWLDTLDDQYFDQSQFVRDFHRFIGCSPTDYANTPHPVLLAAAKARAALAGDAVQALQKPKQTLVTN